uniref:hypothetical protein n=1 Tax=Bacteroides thetaiotaomicron TaxID=818 RepID=UPI00321B4CC7
IIQIVYFHLISFCFLLQSILYKSGKLNKESKILVEAGLYPLRAQTVLPILIPGLPEPNRKIEKR